MNAAVTCPLAHILRPAVDSDMAVVRDPWVQEMRHAPWSRGVPDDIYFPEMKAFVGRVLARANTLVACNPEDPKHVYGFVTFDPPNHLHWVYVKRAYQGVGLGRTLVEATGIGPKIVATQASSGCYDRFDRKTHERTHVGYFSPDRSTRIIFNPLLHTHPFRRSDASREIQSASDAQS